MKRLLSFILVCIIVLSFVACSEDKPNATESTQTIPTQTSTDTPNSDIKDKINSELEGFKGIVYLSHKGNLIYSMALGKDENGNNLTIDSPMYLGSVSKQFCATAVMMLEEQGKLSVEDTLDKYFPEYKNGKDITIKNLLTMRSGIPEMLSGVEGHSADKEESENISIIKEWIFAQPLNSEPDTNLEYSNTNYFLLGNIVETVSGQHYNDFIRENIFKPLGMEHTGFINEVKDNPFFSKGLTYNTFTACEDAEGLTKGAGDIISTAPDMDKWMTGLQSGKIISVDSYNEMKKDHSPDFAVDYGYGLTGMYENGTGHSGGIGDYVSVNYFNEEHGYNLFAVTTESHNKIERIPSSIMDILIGE